MTTTELSARASLAHTRSLLAGGHPVRILFLGDSITNGAGIDRWEDSYVALWVEYLRTKHETPVRVANVSSGGCTSADGVAVAASAATEVLPDLAVIAYGVNDQKAIKTGRFRRADAIAPDAYRANIAMAARVVQFRAGADVVLVGPCLLPIATESHRYRDVLIQLASEYGYGFADPLAFWHDGPDLIAADGVHPSAAGHRLYADALIAHVDL